MCTVSYLPLRDGWIITSNRDETPTRHASVVTSQQIDDHLVSFPRDPQAGGSWFAWSDAGFVACLLNGAYLPFDPLPSHTESRGNVVLNSFRWSDIKAFSEEYDFSRTAPFTLLLNRRDSFTQLIWDGNATDLSTLDPQTPQFWSSVTLYSEDVRQWRARLFREWLRENEHFLQDEIIDFHRYGGRGDTENDFVMDRDGVVQTLCISSVMMKSGILQFRYVDLFATENNRFSTTEVARLDKTS